MKPFLHRHALWIFPTIVFGLLLIAGARAHPLWGDEAETALFARNILRYGVPRGWDGTNIMGINNAVVLNTELINHTSPWAQYYLVATAFALLGQSDLAARIPSVICAILSLPVLYLLVRALTLSKRIAALSVLILSVSVPYLLFSFQARYYSLVTLCALLLTYWSLRLVRDASWKSYIGFVLSAAVFYYGNYVVFAAFYAALFLAMSTWYRFHGRSGDTRRFMVAYLVAGCLTAVCTAPWFFLMRPFGDRGNIVLPGVIDFFRYLAGYIGIALYPYHLDNAFPIGMLMLYIGAVVSGLRRGISVVPVLIPFLLPMAFLTVMAAFTVIGDVDTSFVHTRYTMLVLPFFAVCAALAVDGIWRWRTYAGLMALALYVGTNALSFAPVRSFPYEYIREVLHPYKTPDMAVAEYLGAHAKSGDTAFVNLDRDHEPLIFRLGTKIRFVNRVTLVNTRIFPKNRGIIPRYIYDFRGTPDWVILYGKRGNDNTFLTFDDRPLPPEIDLARDYTEAVLPVFFSDMSRPEMELRSFREIVPAYRDQIFVYRKK